MKFRTEIESISPTAKIDYSTKIFAVGSCFAQNIAHKLIQAKFKVNLCPTGILFNPISIATALTNFTHLNAVNIERIVTRGDSFVSLDSHSCLAQATLDDAISALNNAIAIGHKALSEANCVIITFGTAWVYEHIATKSVVANCHKQPQSDFIRRRLSVEEIITTFTPLMEGILSDKHVIFTLSPVRHPSDGLTENSLSKATLRLAIAELCSRFNNADYFPAYEIVTDDLRDYRFYAEDLVHPSNQAIEYIWEKFTEAMFTERTKQLLPKVMKIVTAATHRPFNSISREYKEFCHKQLEAAMAIEEVDFSDECAIFSQYSDKS